MSAPQADNADPLLEYRPTHLPRAGEVIVIDRRPWHICSIIHEQVTNIVWITVRSPAAFAKAMREASGQP